MFSLKPLSPSAIPAALAKAERYRLLNEPGTGREHLRRRACGGTRQPAGAGHADPRDYRRVSEPVEARVCVARRSWRPRFQPSTSASTTAA